jgi:dihydrofolate reductase
MRTVVVCNIMSLDGYYTGPDDNVMVMPMNPSFDAMNVEHMRAADTLLLGRTSYEGFRSYWPPVADDPAASEDNREISRRYREIGIVVVSDSLAPDPSQPLAANTTIVGRSDAAGHVARLKESDGGNILIFGSHTMWTGLMAAGVVDELHLMIGAAVVGGGRPMFGRTGPHLTLLGTRTYDGSDNVVVRYAVSRTGATVHTGPPTVH